MITDSFDDRSPAKINVKKNEHAVPADAVIFTFSQKIEKYVIAHYDCEKVGEFSMACGATSVYLLIKASTTGCCLVASSASV